ncbi:4a-hydroxytetrahydrobiopterin dehydratase [Nocardioides sp. DS6]|uniref:Putative pterin-4-alpha-carbinolamine dehydratase n=1 Tax=Nocardioides eburneus TaxID=3231482 RepID=A0ABV3SUB9_9ACTN
MPIPDEDRVVLEPSAVAAELLSDWRLLAGQLCARFSTGTFVRGVTLVDRLAEEAEKANHHPDVDLRYGHVEVRLVSHDVGGITQRDVRLARVISAIADQMGASPQPAALQVVGLALDTPDPATVSPFWQTVLGAHPDPSYDAFLVAADGPGLYLQQTDEPRGFHVDVDVPDDVADLRIRQALDHGGRLVSDARAPAWTTLADAQGNRVDIATWLGRD